MAQRTYCPNPDWVDELLHKNWKGLQRRVPESMLPMLGRQKRQYEWKSIKELGCGKYGCVVPTHDPRWVLKVTTDGREAAFAAQAIQIGNWPRGMTRYDAAYAAVSPTDVPPLVEVTMSMYDRGIAKYMQPSENVYVLWREASVKPGAAGIREYGKLVGAGPKVVPRVHDTLWKYITFAYHALLLLDTQDDPYRPHFLKKYTESEQYAMMMGFHGDDGKLTGDPSDDDEPMFFADVAACADVAAEMAADPVLADVGKAFLFYQKHGMILADIHKENLGLIVRGQQASLAVIDPGGMVPTAVNRLNFELQQL